jgi:asparagine synthase (glutamine-hydrolysing)
MCGIAGYLRLSDDIQSTPNLVGMTRLLKHRGPDSEGFYHEPGIGLGMRRLRVIDLETGEQPMANERGDVQVIQNGEIYNFRQLRQELEDRGHRFATRSDTEVLVHGWEEWGEGLPLRLRGMFAFALWDRQKRQLFIARDPLGIKPLYYTEAGGHLLFASEIKSLLFANASREVDPQALDTYLSFLYIPEPRTIFRHIHALPPGHTLSCHRECREVRHEVHRYWRFEPRPEVFRSRKESLDRVREVFEDSVQAMMVADVPVGLFLSGGIDSASILAMMARHSNEPVRTFSIGFGTGEHRWDELAEARQLAEAFSSRHHEIRVEPELVHTLPEVVRSFDQPFANPTAVILKLLSREARRHTTVALSGTGGDELFAGYPRYLGMLLYQRYRWLPTPLRRAAASLANRFLRDRTDGRLFFHRARRFLEGGALPFDACYARLLMTLEGARKEALYTPSFAQSLGDFETTAFLSHELLGSKGDDKSPVERLLATDIATYLPFNQLTYGDRMSMAHSLELRVPFVDQRVVEVAATIPLAQNLRGTTKGLFREAMAPFLPSDVVQRAKLGLNLPIALWFRGELQGWMEELLAPERLEQRGYFRPDAVGRLMKEHTTGFRDHSLFLWALVVLEIWHQAYLDGVND